MFKYSIQDIRWRQRFQNFLRAFKLLRSAFEDRDIENYSDLELEGIIQRFEYTFELAWKTFKDYLDDSGILIKEASPRKVIKECASSGIFNEASINPEIFLDMMLTRNNLSHTYDFEIFKQAVKKIKEQYLKELENEYFYFMQKELDFDI